MKCAVLLSIDENLDEMRALLRTLEIRIDKEVIQRRNAPHRKTFLGPGKIEEINEDIVSLDVDYVVINGDLKPSQHHALEMLLQKECVDRIGVILRIFSEHAHTEEAKNQVALATMRYELPFLREWIHKAKSGERPGFLSGGAYATEVYYEHARSHIRRIEDNLETRSKQREIRRTMRRKKGYYLVSLAGYTNAGKSALLNALSGSQEVVDDQLFSTLSTATRRVSDSRRNILLTDTVGFISRLPPDLVNAFNSTLEEIFFADLVLVVVDVSEPVNVVVEKLKTTLDALVPKLNGKEIIIVGSKMDRTDTQRRQEVERKIKMTSPSTKIVFTSATNRIGLTDLITSIESYEGRDHIMEASLPLTDESFSLISELHDSTDVETSTIGEAIEITLSCRLDEVQKVAGKIKAIGGVVTVVSRRPLEG